MSGSSDFVTDHAQSSVPNNSFAARAASQTWEMAPLANSAQHVFWVWYKPANFPHGLAVNIPAETFQGYPDRAQLTIRKLLQSLALSPAELLQWSQHGSVYDALQGTAPNLDQPLAGPVPDADGTIYLSMAAPSPVAYQPPAAAAPLPADAASIHGDIFENIDSEWKAIEKTERDLGLCRRKLSDILSRLNTLNRDLTHDELMHADNADKTAWQDARRWLRETAVRVSRNLKDCDVGDATNVVKRQWMEQTYEQYITQRQYFDGIHQAHREFEGYRKMVQTLFVNMNTAYASAVTDGERRAQQVLAQIAAKSRRKK